ncbi:uncharacterized protein LOC112253723 [Oncorhynchus tshawytscha]|uniref:C-type lectin domain-containing protein n=1 Tax=Oncorhynchus tshawytscha TaxID=74940 RepID=A0AAZ3QG11_ONCTS|nr:uncharacterized protein LOC112253723 [Oncorhynchus tshawytscha]
MQRKSSFTGLLITALCAVASGLTSKKYYHVNKILTWHGAQQYCREHYTDLAFISNQEEAELVFNIKETTKVMWIGLYRDNNDPIGWKWSGGEDSEFRLWGKKEPNKGESELILVQENKTWMEALKHCRNHHTDLPSLLSETEQLQAQSKMKGAQTDHVWTGLRFHAGYWLWVNGDALEYQAGLGTGGKLPQCPGSYHCGTLAKEEEYWGIRDCEEMMNFLCYRK